MEQQTLFIPKCPNNHDVEHLCLEPTCICFSIVCSNKQCDYFKNHESCFNMVRCSMLINKLIQKERSYHKGEQKLVIQFLELIIKRATLTIQYIKTKTQNCFKLKGKQLEMYNLLKNGPIKDIMTSRTSEVITILKTIQNIQNNKIDKLKEKIQQSQHQINKIFNYYKDYIIQSPEQQMCFSNKFHHQKIQIQEKRAKSIYTNQYKYVLLEPSLSPFKISYHKFYIKNMISWLGVGCCCSSIIKKNDYILNLDNHKSYLVSANGYSWSGFQNQKNRKQFFQAFSSNDTIIVKYDPNENKIKFKKENSDKIFVLLINPLLNEQLYMCIVLYGINSEVQYRECSQNQNW